MVLHLKRRLSKSGLTAFILLLLTRCCAGRFQVLGPSQPVIVTVGDDVVLPCRLKPAADAAFMTFEWARPDLIPTLVHVWRDSRDLHVGQHPSYRGRTSVSFGKLQGGDVSLTLSEVKLSDTGTYRCYFPELDKDSAVQLVVGAASSPVVSVAGIDRSVSGVVLHCESAGWYPEPEVFWLDGEGNLLPAGPAEAVRGPDGLCTVSSRVTVEKRRSSSSFTCRVQQKNINRTRQAQIHVPDEFFVASCSSAACIAVSLVACFASVLALVFTVWRWRRNKIKTRETLLKENQRLMAENEHMKDIEEKMAKLAEKLERKERERKEMVDALKELRKELEEPERGTQTAA